MEQKYIVSTLVFLLMLLPMHGTAFAEVQFGSELMLQALAHCQLVLTSPDPSKDQTKTRVRLMEIQAI